MSENLDTTTDSVPVGPVVYEQRDRRLHRALAWVGIIAGVVFTIAVVFFSGFVLGRSSGYHGWHRGYQGQMGRDGGCPMMRGGSMMGPGGMDPDEMGPGMMRPGPASSVPSSTVPAPR